MISEKQIQAFEDDLKRGKTESLIGRIAALLLFVSVMLFAAAVSFGIWFTIGAFLSVPFVWLWGAPFIRETAITVGVIAGSFMGFFAFVSSGVSLGTAQAKVRSKSGLR